MSLFGYINRSIASLTSPLRNDGVNVDVAVLYSDFFVVAITVPFRFVRLSSCHQQACGYIANVDQNFQIEKGYLHCRRQGGMIKSARRQNVMIHNIKWQVDVVVKAKIW